MACSKFKLRSCVEPVRSVQWLALTVFTASTLAPLAATDFHRDIKPIFAERCYSCHGAEKHKGGLRLDRKTDALQGGDSGVAIVPHKSAESLLFKNVSGANPDSLMPPKGDPLTPAQLALIKQWIDGGAPWPDENAVDETGRNPHWAFQPPQRPEIPSVKNKRWPRNAIDHFVLARLEQEKIKPSPEADRITLIRRLNFDLLGLPPSPEEVEAFLQDKAPDAYERLVDCLLASKHFGERWGRHWLDLARYADSDGYEKDSPRPYAYLYRDWVIEAINRDLAFDQFTVEQLAGDLLPNATKEQKIATGFHRQTLLNKEGGVDQEEYRNKAVVDRVDTTGAVWLGLTVGCAECHSHKYDPITQREFYELFAFFNNADEEDLPAPASEQLEEYHAAKKKWDDEQARLKTPYDTYVRESLPAMQAAWETTGKLDLAVWNVLEPVSVASANGATLAVQSDQSVLASGMNPLTETYTVETKAISAGITGFRIEVLPDDQGKPGRTGHGNFVLSEFSVTVHRTDGREVRTLALTNATADFSQKDWAAEGAIDGNAKTGWAIAPQNKQRHVAVFECVEPLNLAAGDKLLFTLAQQYGNQHTLARLRLSATASSPPLKAALTDDLVAAAWNLSPDKRTPAQTAGLEKYFREEVDAETKRLRQPIEAHAKSEPKFPETKAATLAERDRPRETHIHVRGDFLRPGDRVEPATPAVLHDFKPRAEKADRLDLARWLMDGTNPLTSRVSVNHVWKNLFGCGLVTSVNDFGTRGEQPSHPELLDWLATEFPRRGWSRKALIKLIVASATYRQSSRVRPELLERDPLNALLARQNRLRFEAEIVRDAHLAVSGLLCDKIGGPSVRPPLPADIAALGYANSVKWKESEGEDRFRRGMYVFFQRTVPYPMLMTFDAPDSNTSCTRRERSNTPLQALTLWNDPVFFDCARALGKRMASEATLDAQLKRAFELCLARLPSRTELSRLHRLYEDQLRMARESPESALAITGLAKETDPPYDAVAQASLVAVARVIMNLDEFITRD